MPPRFSFLPPRGIFLEEVGVFGRKKTSKFEISARKKLRISAKTFFFWTSPAFGRKICDFGQKKPLDFGEDLFFFGDHLRLICDFGQKKPSHFSENLCPPDFNFVPPPISRSPCLLPIQNPGYVYALNLVQYAYRSLHLSTVSAPLRAVAYNIAKVQSNKIYIRCIASSLHFLWYGSMEWNMEENFRIEWNMEWKIFGKEWKKITSMECGRKLPVWNMEKSSSIPSHTMP